MGTPLWWSPFQCPASSYVRRPEMIARVVSITRPAHSTVTAAECAVEARRAGSRLHGGAVGANAGPVRAWLAKGRRSRRALRSFGRSGGRSRSPR